MSSPAARNHRLSFPPLAHLTSPLSPHIISLALSLSLSLYFPPYTLFLLHFCTHTVTPALPLPPPPSSSVSSPPPSPLSNAPFLPPPPSLTPHALSPRSLTLAPSSSTFLTFDPFPPFHHPLFLLILSLPPSSPFLPPSPSSYF